MNTRVRAATALPLLAVLAACSRAGGPDGPGAVVAAASVPAPAQGASAAAATASPPVEVLPLVILHGIWGEPAEFAPLLDRIGEGRVVLRDVYAKDAEALAPASLPPALVVAAGYYREARGAPRYDPDPSGRGQDSIGGCPAPRTDGLALLFPISYVDRIRRIVDGVRRATGAPRVDLALHSMGTLVGRAYTRWRSVDPATGRSAVRRILLIAGPNRGVNALEASATGLSVSGARDFMRMGELAELCYEYRAWSGRSFVDHLNDGWDTFCASAEIGYAGITGVGAHGKQEPPAVPGAPPPSGPTLFGIALPKPLDRVARAIMNMNAQTLGQVAPLVAVWTPRPMPEIDEAMRPSDGTVRVQSARVDTAPFAGAAAHVVFEGRHADPWNPEQTVYASRLTAELVRGFLGEGVVPVAGASVVGASVRAVDAPGRASWIAVDVELAGGSLISAQLVEERTDASGHDLPAEGHGAALREGAQRFLVAVPPGGGTRRYRLVLYGPEGPVCTSDATLALRDGPVVEREPEAHLAGARSQATAVGPRVRVTATSDAPAGEPSLRYSWRVDHGAWTTFVADDALETPPLAAGTHEVEARARHAHNAAGVVVDTAAAARLTIVVDRAGNASFVP